MEATTKLGQVHVCSFVLKDVMSMSHVHMFLHVCTRGVLISGVFIAIYVFSKIGSV